MCVFFFGGFFGFFSGLAFGFIHMMFTRLFGDYVFVTCFSCFFEGRLKTDGRK